MKLKKSMCSIVLLAGVALTGTPGAFADVTVVYKMSSPDGSGMQTIFYTDEQHVRLDMTGAANNKTTMMKLGNKVYAITGEVVQDMSQLAKMMASMGMGKKGENKGENKAQTSINYEDTGKTETIAGIRGKVYRFVENGRSHEVVLGKNKDLQDAALGVVEITKAATGMMSFDTTNGIQEDASLKNMALLRLDDRVLLQSINTRAIPAATFKLPSEPQQMGGMGGLMKGVLGK
ncbi:hypothetical protein MNBD_GAMMA14-467 [hydrothermal vent metagenome]|uniref:DUF4412 domain-containing protein n=1 Tax=hydrothermal vent metagenome TaxID=652676 RepID=A0A3B0YDX5_9ZZZZ